MAVSVLCAVYVPQAPHILPPAAPRIFAVETKSNNRKNIQHFFTCPIEWMERRAFRCSDESYCCFERPESAMEEKRYQATTMWVTVTTTMLTESE